MDRLFFVIARLRAAFVQRRNSSVDYGPGNDLLMEKGVQQLARSQQALPSLEDLRWVHIIHRTWPEQSSGFRFKSNTPTLLKTSSVNHC